MYIWNNKTQPGQAAHGKASIVSSCTYPLVILLAVWMGLLPELRAQTPALTTVKDTVYKSDGTLASGSVVITWDSFHSQDSKPVFGGSKTVTLNNGALAVALVPNVGATPTGTSYSVRYYQSGAVYAEEFWVVPNSNPVAPPSVPAVTGVGSTASTTYCYWVSAVLAVGETNLSPSGCTTTGPNSLNSSNYNQISWSAVSGAISCRVFRTSFSTVPAGTGNFLVASTAALLWNDQSGSLQSASIPEVNTTDPRNLQQVRAVVPPSVSMVLSASQVAGTAIVANPTATQSVLAPPVSGTPLQIRGRTTNSGNLFEIYDNQATPNLRNWFNSDGAFVTNSQLVLPSFLSGSVLFASSGGMLSQNNGQLFWDSTENRLRVGPRTGFSAILGGLVNLQKNSFSTLNPPAGLSAALGGVSQSNSSSSYNIGIHGVTESGHSTGNRLLATGAEGVAYHTGSGTISYLTGLSGFAENSSPIGGNAEQLAAISGYGWHSGESTTTNMSGLHLFSNGKSAGSITNNYGIKIEDQTAGVNNWAIKTGMGKVEFGGPVSTPRLNNIRFADQFTGADAGAKIIAAIADLPATGGTVDARGFEGAQAITSSVSIAKPITLLLGAATYTFSGTGAISITVQSEIIGLGQAITILSDTTTSGNTITANVPITAGFGARSAVRLSGFELIGPGNATGVNNGIVINSSYQFLLENILVSAFGQDGVTVDTTAALTISNSGMMKAVTSQSNGRYGFFLTPIAANSNLITIANCFAHSNLSDGFRIASSATVFIGPDSSGNTGYGYRFTTATDSQGFIYGENNVAGGIIFDATASRNNVALMVQDTITDNGANNAYYLGSGAVDGWNNFHLKSASNGSGLTTFKSLTDQDTSIAIKAGITSGAERAGSLLLQSKDGTNKWSLHKTSANVFNIQDVNTGSNRLQIVPGGNVNLNNNADAALSMTINSGSTVNQLSQVAFQSLGAQKYSFGWDPAGADRFFIYDGTLDRFALRDGSDNLYSTAGAGNHYFQDSSSTIRIAIAGASDTVFFGSAFDTNLYRSAANVLKTDDTLVAAIAFQSAAADPADTGVIRLGNNESIAAEADVAGTDGTLKYNASEQWEMNSPLVVATSVPLVFDGATPDGNKTTLSIIDPTTSRILTIPNADSVTVQPQVCGGTDKVSAISAAGVVTCSADQSSGGGGGGDNVRVEDGNNAGTYTAMTDADFDDSGDIDFQRTIGPPDIVVGVIRADSVTLTTDTTGNFVQQVLDGTGIDGAAIAEGASYTPTLDLSEINDTTFGDNSDADIVHTIDPTGTSNPSWTYSDGIANLNSGTLQQGGAGVVVNSRTLTAGNGLSGGGDLSTNRTLDVAVTAPIELTADTVACSSCTTSSNSQTLSNKTFDSEGSGNILVLPQRIEFVAAGCDGSIAAAAFDLPTANAPAKSCQGTSPHRYGVLDFADGAAQLTANTRFLLPSDWTATGGADIKFIWSSGSISTNSIVWTVQTACVSDGEDSLNPSYNAVQTLSDANNAAANTRNSASITGITFTGCSSGETLYVRIGRDPTSGSDTLAATGLLHSIELTIRRQI